MATNLDYMPEETPSSPVRLAEKSAFGNPLFSQTIDSIKNPGDRKAFYDMLKQTIRGTYKNNPQIRRLLKTHDIADKVGNVPDDAEDPRQNVVEQSYAEPGRSYNYMNNFMGGERTKEGMLEKSAKTIGGLGKETWKGLGALGGWYAANKWYTTQAAKGFLGRAGTAIGAEWAKKGILDYLLPWRNISSGIKAGSAFAGKEMFLGTIGKILTPSLYLIGGYLLYKTIRYFLNKRRENLESEERNKLEFMRNNVAAQNAELYRMVPQFNTA